MSKSNIFALVLLGTISLSAQEFQGHAEYFSKRIVKKKAEVSGIKSKEPIDLEFQKEIDVAIKNATEKEFLLVFTKSESLYEENKKLDKPFVAGESSLSISFSSAGKKYLNLKENKSLVEDEVFDKEFLIEEPLVRPNWKLINETKKIGEYNCFKAELLVPVSEKQKQDYEDFLKREQKKSSLFKMHKPEEQIVIAWYTPEIPVSFGPDNYWGLPGLILEINKEKFIILCSKVTIGNKEKSKIKVPNMGEKVTQKKFDEILTKKTKSMQNEDGVIIFEH
ncbi:GLPGLI family protein [Flavobacterium sp.]|uniref:GLPGLI family protein n=1 Tax=Flavobacterium sp. TaxID=239 RepID=UPI0025DE2F2B|nr:GLPGLI family protein [Flavobacterium sp.]